MKQFSVKEVSERVLASDFFLSTVWEYLVCQPQYDEGANYKGSIYPLIDKVTVEYSSRSSSILAIFAHLFHFELIFPAILANFSLFDHMASFLSK